MFGNLNSIESIVLMASIHLCPTTSQAGKKSLGTKEPVARLLHKRLLFM
jgi:hypothetical protein